MPAPMYICEVCGKEFCSWNPKPRFCSVLCKARAQVKNTTVSCPGCGKLFQVKPYRLDPKRCPSGKPACSRACWIEYHRKLRTFQCPICGRTFTPKRKELGQKYCSKRCMGIAYMQNALSSTLYASDFTPLLRKVVRLLFEGHCALCGKPARSVHHIDADKSNNGYGNLTLLCKSCHMHVHRNFASYIGYFTEHDLTASVKLQPNHKCLDSLLQI